MKKQAFNSEEKKFKEFSVPELFNKNVYSNEYKDIRHWTLFLKDLYFDRSLLKEKEYNFFLNLKSEAELASLFIQNMSWKIIREFKMPFKKISFKKISRN